MSPLRSAIHISPLSNSASFLHPFVLGHVLYGADKCYPFSMSHRSLVPLSQLTWCSALIHLISSSLFRSKKGSYRVMCQDLRFSYRIEQGQLSFRSVVRSGAKGALLCGQVVGQCMLANWELAVCTTGCSFYCLELASNVSTCSFLIQVHHVARSSDFSSFWPFEKQNCTWMFSILL